MNRVLENFRLGELVHRLRWVAESREEAAVFAGALLLVVLSVLFGGASQVNAISQMVVELAAFPLLFVAGYLTFRRGRWRGAVAPLLLAGAILAVPLLQLMPLPYSIWSKLPGRAPVVQIMDLARLGKQAMPFSMTPEETWRDLLGLLPPLAMVFGALMLTSVQKRILVVVWLVLAVVELMVGGLQVLGGMDSPLYFYSITNAGTTVGFFANRNHLAIFFCCMLPFAAMFATQWRGRLASQHDLLPASAALFIPVIIVGIAVAHSRAGIALAGVSLLGSLAVALRSGAMKGHWATMLGVLAATVAGLAAVALFGLTPILERFQGPEAANELRFENWPGLLKLAKVFLPLGTGLGGFETVYRVIEPLEQVGRFYFNHAHNDYLELWIETGYVCVALVVAFLAWFLRGAWIIWFGKTRSKDAGFLAACTVLPVLLMLHSTLDYPLRTETVSVLFAFACGCMASGLRRRRAG